MDAEEEKLESHPALAATVAKFKAKPLDLPLRSGNASLHPTSARLYTTFCGNRTAGLYVKFLSLIGDSDLSWLGDSTFMPSFTACAPFHSKKDERPVQGDMSRGSREMNGLVRYDYKQNIIEECRKFGKPHGLRVVCTQMGHIWIRLHDDGKRLAQLVLNSDLSEQSSVDDGGLDIVRANLDLIAECFKR